MEINGLLTEFKKPNCYILIGNDYLFIVHKNMNKNSRKYFDFSLLKDVNSLSEDIKDKIKVLINQQEAGIILNSSFFVFNILKFDKIPFSNKKTVDIVNWRIEKIFPENLDNYINSYYKLDSTHILSILLKKDIKARIDTFMDKLGIKYTHLGCSTVEIANTLYASYNPLNRLINKSKLSDFFIEIWNNSATIMFQKKSIPFYIRKFVFSDTIELISEIEKTNIFITKNYNFKPTSFNLFKNNTNIEEKEIAEALLDKEIKLIKKSYHNSVFINGVSE